jgi:cytochrome c peroxidase
MPENAVPSAPRRRGFVRAAIIAAVAGIPAAIGLTLSAVAVDLPTNSPLGTIPVPVENPFTEAKRVLGKALFWDEQLSADNTMACGSCHMPEAGYGDPRVGLSPGPDGIAGTPDDKFGSPGVIASDANEDYDPAPFFGLQRQVTDRSAPLAINTAFSPELFWDGRARSQFVDPETGAVAIASGGALESQAVGPPLSAVEMAHADRDWSQISAKLVTARPLALAHDLPPDLTAMLAGNPGYPELFEAAFGDGAITAQRIAFAIASYQRTLIADQTPWDAMMAGDPDALTPEQDLGWDVFRQSNCLTCHRAPLFTDHTFRNIGLRPVAEDRGRQNVTNNNADRGKFKTPSLRNAALKPRMMHNGQFSTMQQVVQFYAQPAQQFPDNRDPQMQLINIPPQVAPALEAFLTGALTDPRVAARQAPFDAPRLHSQLPTPNPLITGPGRPDSTGTVPRIIALSPPNLGNDGFKIGLARVWEGAVATLAISTTPPVAGEVSADQTLGPFIATDPDGFEPCATARWPIPDDGALDGVTYYMQWRVDDPSLTLPALSRVAEVTLFCGNGDCPPASSCPADLNGDGIADFGDVAAFVTAFTTQDALADLNDDGVLDFGDVGAFVTAFNLGC